MLLSTIEKIRIYPEIFIVGWTNKSRRFDSKDLLSLTTEIIRLSISSNIGQQNGTFVCLSALYLPTLFVLGQVPVWKTFSVTSCNLVVATWNKSSFSFDMTFCLCFSSCFLVVCLFRCDHTSLSEGTFVGLSVRNLFFPLSKNQEKW